MPLDDLIEQQSDTENNTKKVDNHTEKVDTHVEKFDMQTEKINIFDEHSDNCQNFAPKIYTNEELDNYTRKINYYTKKRMDYVLKEAYQKNYERYLEEKDLEDLMRAEKQKQRIKETIILCMIQKTKKIQEDIPATIEKIQELIKDLETAVDILKLILNLISNPLLKKLFKTGFKLIKKFNKHLRNNDIILTGNDYLDIKEKSLKLISEAERFREHDSVANLMESFCALINSILNLNERMLANQEKPSLRQKFKNPLSKPPEHVPLMEEKTFIKTFSSGEIPPQEFESEDGQRKNS